MTDINQSKGVKKSNKRQLSTDVRSGAFVPFWQRILGIKKFSLSSFLKKGYVNTAQSLDSKKMGARVDAEKIKNETQNYFEIGTSKKSARKSTRKNTSTFSGLSVSLKASFAFLSFAFLFLVFSVVSVFAFQSRSIIPKQPQQQVAGVNEVVVEDELDSEGSEAYAEWMLSYSDTLELPYEDKDEDGLTNMEEFLLGSNPVKAATCGDERKDAEKLVELIDPATCKQIPFDNQVAMKKYDDIVDFDKLRNSFFKEIIQEEPEEVAGAEVDPNSLQSVFGVSTVEELNGVSLDKSTIDTKIQQLEEQKKVIDLIAKVDEYIQQYRSFEPYDREYEVPVTGAVYVDVAKRYNTPLKYVLAIAQRESRFGTDRYTRNGNPTRPGQYQNIFSMGLDDSGNNIGFETWEKGVESFGRWYRRFDDAGVPDCNKWRIYNPNGDYCARVNETAGQIDFFLGSLDEGY